MVPGAKYSISQHRIYSVLFDHHHSIFYISETTTKEHEVQLLQNGGLIRLAQWCSSGENGFVRRHTAKAWTVYT